MIYELMICCCHRLPQQRKVCSMTEQQQTESAEFERIYQLNMTVLPTNKLMI
jgi:preprotein translocase subunit SecA